MQTIGQAKSMSFWHFIMGCHLPERTNSHIFAKFPHFQEKIWGIKIHETNETSSHKHNSPKQQNNHISNCWQNTHFHVTNPTTFPWHFCFLPTVFEVPDLFGIPHFRKSGNPIYGGRDTSSWQDHPQNVIDYLLSKNHKNLPAFLCHHPRDIRIH